jgi:phosphate transport system permease protein
VWYEGYTGPERVWQSSGGTDEFESKFSLWPLIFGTLKGTFYAMIFAVPIAVLGAIYLSQLASTGLRNVLKPLIELMAAIPSVVVGFFAGLWLAPALDTHLTSSFLMFFSVPAAWFLLVCAWWVLPDKIRPETGGKKELLFLLPVMVAALLTGWAVAPGLERIFFHGDLKQWLYGSLGLLYDPRNCVVVGFALGFAVIPIIFTISEDALSAVPPSLTAASYALAASRWQTAINVVLPAASPGIFAAVMLGLGRAVGETMIVLMATGNTPIVDMSIFNGMRAMSATIAVEMPEAPVGGNLYRILFLVGFLLFAFTFIINTLAELISVRLRKKYSRF